MDAIPYSANVVVPCSLSTLPFKLFIMKESKHYWLIKSEPNTRLHNGKDIKFSIEDLEKCNTSIWDGVRNYEARNILRDKMKLGDLCLFYHSSCPIPGIVGLARIITEGYPDRK